MPYMFNDGHLWYIYMFIGVILFVPIIFPWRSATKRQPIFLVCGSLHLSPLYKFFANTNEWISIFGECKWNEFSTLRNFSGYIGYVVLAYYIRDITWNRAKA